MKLRTCPCCNGRMRISESANPDFVVKHDTECVERAIGQNCTVYSMEGNEHLRASSENEAAAKWNAFCEGWRRAAAK